MITRRIFLRNSALAVVGTAAVPSFLTRAAFGAIDAGMSNKRLVVIFQRRSRQRTSLSRTPSPSITPCGPASTFRETQCSISTAASVCIHLCRRFSRSGSRDMRHRARGRLARHHALALRRAGFHGDRNSRREGYR